MAESQRPQNDEVDPQSKRLTPSVGLRPGQERRAATSDIPSDSSNEDFLFHLYRGSELLQDNRVHEAKEELERALRLQPRDTQGQDLLAVVYFRLGLYPRAIGIFEQLRRKNPKDTALLLNLALCYLKTGQHPQARTALEQLVAINPGHARAWGYLGLACERCGDFDTAERAFREGGHEQMARRVRERRSIPPAAIDEAPEEADAAPARPEEPDARAVVAGAFQELDTGELAFGIAEPSPGATGNAPQAGTWSTIELGGAPSSARPPRIETKKPDTKDGPPAPPAVMIPRLGGAPPPGRPTLLVGAAPAADAPPDAGVPGFDKIPSPRPPTFTPAQLGQPSFRHPVVAVPPVRSARLDPPPEVAEHRKTLQPPVPEKRETSPPPPASELAARSSVEFPARRGLVLHPSGVALVRTIEKGAGFSARLEAVRAASSRLQMRLLERQSKGKPTGESFGGVTSPLVHATGDGELMLGPRAGRKLSSFALEDEMCFVREEVLLGFDGEVTYENGRLSAGEGEHIAIVQLRGTGGVVVEAVGEVLSLAVVEGHAMSIRRETVLGWFGRLVPRALPPSEAPCGQRGLVSFAGEGRVLVASA